MDKEKEMEQNQSEKKMETGADVESVLKQLMEIESMFDDFLTAEAEGMVICENCYDNFYDDEEGVCRYEDSEGNVHFFCSKECMDEWKSRG